MLDPWIIEEIKRKEKRGRIEQPVIQIPVQGPERERNEKDRDGGPKPRKDEEEDPRGIAIIDFGVANW
jgi:hypothetical protein